MAEHIVATVIPEEHRRAFTAGAGRRIPLGFGLLLAAAASVGLWTLVIAAARSLF